MAYTTNTELKTYLRGFEDASTTDDTFLTSCITRAQASIDRYCHRTFEASTNTTKTFDAVKDVGDGTLSGYNKQASWESAELQRTLWIDSDLATINTVTNGDGTIISSSDYTTLPRRKSPIHAIVLKLDSNIAWTWTDSPEEAITISGKWAYSVSAPDDIVQATLRLSAWLYKQGENYNAGIDRPVESPSGVLILPMEFPRDVLTLLNPFRRL